MCIEKEGVGTYQARPYAEDKVKSPTTQRENNEKILAILMEMRDFSAKILEMADNMKTYYLGSVPENVLKEKGKEPVRICRDGFFDKILNISRETQNNLSDIYEILSKM